MPGLPEEDGARQHWRRCCATRDASRTPLQALQVQVQVYTLDCNMVYFHFLTHRLRTCTIFCGFFGLIIFRFGSPDFKVLSYGPISIKFGMRVHLMVLYAANDCIVVYFDF